MTRHKKLHDLRKEYTQGGLSITQVLPDPFEQFNLWFDQAVFAELEEPNAMTLATAQKNGRVSARIVLLKELDQKGFVFFTNYNSNKGIQIQENPFAALVFLWLPLERQVRIEGAVEKIDPVDSEIYFDSRPRESQLGAWASDQSRELNSRDKLYKMYARLEKEYEGKTIPRPLHWGGYRLLPDRFEFWQGRPGRLHDRILYIYENNLWERKRLSP